MRTHYFNDGVMKFVFNNDSNDSSELSNIRTWLDSMKSNYKEEIHVIVDKKKDKVSEVTEVEEVEEVEKNSKVFDEEYVNSDDDDDTKIEEERKDKVKHRKKKSK
tara:strand:+ start:106 stop:420 length:315 start_codon:yes stop_codon:yes gene_type:complete